MVDLYYALYGSKSSVDNVSSKTTKFPKHEYKQLFVPATDNKISSSSLKREHDDIRKKDSDENETSLEPSAKKLKPKYDGLVMAKNDISSVHTDDPKAKLDKDKLKKKKKDKKKHKHRHKHKHSKEKDKSDKKEKKTTNVNTPVFKTEEDQLPSSSLGF